MYDAETVAKLATDKLFEIAEIFDKFDKKDESTFMNMSICNDFISITLMSTTVCGTCKHSEPVIHAQKYLDR